MSISIGTIQQLIFTDVEGVKVFVCVCELSVKIPYVVVCMWRGVCRGLCMWVEGEHM